MADSLRDCSLFRIWLIASSQDPTIDSCSSVVDISCMSLGVVYMGALFRYRLYSWSNDVWCIHGSIILTNSSLEIFIG